MDRSGAQISQFFKQRSVLVVDDCEPIRTAIKGMLQTLGFEKIQTASNGQRALQHCESTSFDVVLCDFNLGDGKDGYQLFEETIHRQLLAPNCLFFIISAEARRQVVHGIVELQPDDYLMKPFTYKALGKRLQRAYLKRIALGAIYEAIDARDYQQALANCSDAMKKSPEYLIAVLRIKAELLIKNEDYQSALELYLKLLDKREFPWAWLGVAICHLHLGRVSKAKAMFEELSERPEVRLEALDWLGRLYLGIDKLEESREAFIEASKVSPRNVERQRAIAHLGMANDDLEMAVRAHKRIVEGIRHSVHETPAHHLNYARCLVDLAASSSDLVSARSIKRVNELLREARRRYGPESMARQEQVIYARISALRGDHDEARFLLQDSENYPQFDETMEDRLDKAKTLFLIGEPEKAQSMIDNIEPSAQDSSLSSRTLMAVVAKEHQQQGQFVEEVRKLNYEGMELYKIGAYAEALDCFLQAFEKMPHSASLALNLAQALTKAWSSKLTRQQVLRLCKECIRVIESNTLTHHNQQRYDVIRRDLDEMIASGKK